MAIGIAATQPPLATSASQQPKVDKGGDVQRVCNRLPLEREALPL